MFKWTFKSLFSQKATLFASSFGVASAFILVIFFSSVWQGEAEQVIAYPNKMEPDIWVMQKGVENLHMSMSFVWDWKAKLIEDMPEVKRVTPILYLNSVIVAKEKKLFGFVVGLLDKDNRAGPWELTQGRGIEGENEIVVPDVFRELASLELGDTIQLADRSFNIVAFSKGTYSSANPVFFVRLIDLEKLLSSFGTFSYLLVDSNKGVDNDRLVEKIKQKVSKVNALTHQAFVANDFELAKQMGVEIIFTMTLICSILAVLIIAYSSYALVSVQTGEIAILKALGVRSPLVFMSVIIQSLFMTMLAFLVASLFSLWVLPLIPELVPQITVRLTTSLLVSIGAIAFIVAALGAIFPAYKVLSIDPALVYKN